MIFLYILEILFTSIIVGFVLWPFMAGRNYFVILIIGIIIYFVTSLLRSYHLKQMAKLLGLNFKLRKEKFSFFHVDFPIYRNIISGNYKGKFIEISDRLSSITGLIRSPMIRDNLVKVDNLIIYPNENKFLPRSIIIGLLSPAQIRKIVDDYIENRRAPAGSQKTVGYSIVRTATLTLLALFLIAVIFLVSFVVISQL